MVQEIIVYIILFATAIHILLRSIDFFKPAKNNDKSCSSCASGSCASCSLKFDFDSIQLDQRNIKNISMPQKNKNFR